MSPRYPSTEEPISAAAPVTAALVSPLPVPTHGAGGTFTVLAHTRTSASPLTVLNLIRDTNSWSKWNTFCPAGVITSKSKGKGTQGERKESFGGGEESEGWLEQGTEAVIDVFMSGDGLVQGRKRSRTQAIVVTHLGRIEDEKDGVKRSGYRVAWKAIGWAHWQLHSERVMEFVQREEGGTEYACWETFGGVLGPVVKRMVGGTLVDRFGDYARDVKGFLEGVERVDADEDGGAGEDNLRRRST